MKWWRALTASLLFVAVVFTVFYYHKQVTRYYYKAYRFYKRYNHKPTSGPPQAVPFPENYNIHGLDISRYQEYINWDNLRTLSNQGDTISFSFVFMKATQGTWREDPTFDGNWDDAHTHHLFCGAYHYYMADQDARRQADNYI